MTERDAYEFLIAGGRVALSEWKAIGVADRACLLEAGHTARREFAVMVGIATISEVHAEMIGMSPDEQAETMVAAAVAGGE